MQYSIVTVLALAASVSASYLNHTNTPTNETAPTDQDYIEEVVTHYTIFCPAPTLLHFNDKVYNVTEPGPFVVPDCPCVVRKPVPGKVCNNCSPPPAGPPGPPPPPGPPTAPGPNSTPGKVCHNCAPPPPVAPGPNPPTLAVYHNDTNPPVPPPTVPEHPQGPPPAVGTGSLPGPTPPSHIEANSGNKAIAFSGASLAGLLGLAAYIL